MGLGGFSMRSRRVRLDGRRQSIDISCQSTNLLEDRNMFGVASAQFLHASVGCSAARGQYSRRSPASVSHMLERAPRIERAAQRLLPCGFDASRKRRRIMPEKKTIERAREDKREGKAPSTQAG